MPSAVIILEFEPTLDLGGRLVRWETLALAAVIIVALVLAAWLAGRADPSGDPARERQLRRDDLLYIVVGALPGAVIGGRILHGLAFYDFYLNVDDPGALLDPERGSLSLLGAVLGGTLTATYVGWLIGAPLRRWLDIAIVPLLLAIGLGRFANLLGGAGQGAITDVPWAVAFAGGGPWRSLGADLPAHPSQVYEGIWALAGILVVAFFVVPFVWRHMPQRLRERSLGDPDSPERQRFNISLEDLPPPGRMSAGFLFGVGLAWWAVGRVAVGFTWRDEPIVSGLNVEQVAALIVLVGCFVLLLRALLRRREYEI